MTGAQTRRILSVYRSADAEQLASGLGWYSLARDEACDIARDTGISERQASGIIAALSPQVSWGFNLQWAREVAAGSVINRGFTLSMGRAMMIYRNPDTDPLDILGGDKVRAFYACIISQGETSEVCIDRHACDIATGIRGSFNSLTHKRYRETAQAYRDGAARLQRTGEATLTGAQLQAITWVTWRARYWARGAFDPRMADRMPALPF